ncbi:MAG: hypothetical protein GY765_10780, partial [bacterium]|nr:hypothetical protein [bacterium]
LLMMLLLLSFQAFPEDDKKDKPQTGPGVFQLDPFMMDVLPGGQFFPAFFENYAPDATVTIEENNGFSMLDNPRVYFEGDSFIQFNWQYNGFNINSSLNDGSPAIMLPFTSLSGLRLQGESPIFKDYGMNFVSQMPKDNSSRLMASAVATNLGGPWAKFMIQPSHPTERADMLYNERRKLTDNYFVDYRWSKAFQNSQMMFSVNYFNMGRQFNDFNSFDDFFEETGKMLLLNGRFRKQLNKGYLDILAVYNRMDRNADGAETAALPQETEGREKYSFFTGIHLAKESLDLKLSLTHENEQLNPYTENFAKELIDVDGDGFYPHIGGRLGTFSATTLNASLTAPLRPPFLSEKVKMVLFADGRYASLSGNETTHDFNPVYFADTPYQVVLCQDGTDYKNTNADARAGLRLTVELSKRFFVIGKALMNVNYLDFDNSDNGLSFMTPGFDAGVLYKTKKTRIMLSYGRIPYDIRENVNMFLENGRPSGAIHHW